MNRIRSRAPAVSLLKCVGIVLLLVLLLAARAVPARAASWSLMAAPLPSGSNAADLYGVSCVATDACAAIGTRYDPNGDDLPFAEWWNGTAWSVQSTPAPPSVNQAGLLGVSCVSASWCMAVGTANPPGSDFPGTLVERWNGSAWSIVPAPSPGFGSTPDSELASVSCVSASACVAVGNFSDGSLLAGLAERWNGTSWSMVPVPYPAGTTFAELVGVSCSAADACTAVGVVHDPQTVPLVERWDGSAWSLEPVPAPAGANESGLQSVSCVSASSCMGAGLQIASGGFQGTLTEAWDGSAWSIVPSPNPGTANNALEGVSCTSSSACVGVGAQASASSTTVLIENWDGVGWSTASVASSATSVLRGVSCLAVSWCQAVGIIAPSGGTDQPLVALYQAGSTPSVSTLASGGVPLGGQVSDTATLAGGQSPSGTVTFRLYGPYDTSCSSVPAFTATVPVSGDGNYGSGSFTPATAGSYRWTATYSGDAGNNPASAACGAHGGTVIVARLTAGLATSASGTVPAGGQVSDTAVVSGGRSPTGSIRFRLYAPGDTTCSSAQVFTSRVTVTGDGTYPSPTATLTAAGIYRWTAVYSGDQNNAPASEGCGATGEHATVTKATPALVTAASASVPLGRSVHDVATLSGAEKPTRTITFKLYAPGDTTCTHPPVFTSTITINRNASYSSGLFTPTKAGTYRYTAAYSGDPNNTPASDGCGATGEQVTVT